MKEEKIKVLALLPMELPKEIELDNTLEAMQKFVGGLIEYITMQSLADHMKSAVSPREYQKLQRELNKLQHQIEGI